MLKIICITIAGEDVDENAEELPQPIRPARSGSNTPVHSGKLTVMILSFQTDRPEQTV